MGLDGVELVIRFEDAFGVTISDEVACQLTTPREVTDYLLSQLKMGEPSGCMSQEAFYRLRREFVPVLGIQRADFHPAAKLADLFPIKDRKQVWARLQSQLGAAALPDLARPGWLFSLLSLVTVVTAVTVFHYTRIVSGSGQVAFFASLLVSVAVGYVGAFLTRPLKREFRRRVRQVGELARHLVLNSPHTFKQEWTRDEVAQLVREIVIEQTGQSDFTEDSHFIHDMHID